MTREPDTATRVLVAGIGNLFLGDDGFGPEVVRRLARDGGCPRRSGWWTTASAACISRTTCSTGTTRWFWSMRTRGRGPGEVTVLRIGVEDLGSGEFDAHGMNPVAVLANLEQLGGTLPLTYLVGCTPAGVEEGIGLGEAVDSAVPEAIQAVHTLIRQLVPAVPTASVNSTRPRRS